MDCLVTGAAGFIAGELLRLLAAKNHTVSVVTRYGMGGLKKTAGEFVIGEINQFTDWKDILTNQSTIIHLANRSHILNDRDKEQLAEYRKTNVEGTLALARQASEAGVKRFIYLSSIKVNGEGTFNRPYCFDDAPDPQDPYAISKWEAEQGLKALCAESVMELVIIRPPLVYGPGVKGNLRTLVRAIDRGAPLPLGGISNQRDLISLYNLTDLIVTCVDHPKASGHTFLCSDGCPVSTSELITWIAKARGKKLRLFKLPATILVRLLSIVGKQGLCERLFGDLRIDMTPTQSVLGWEPPVAFEEGVLKAFALDSELNRTTDD
ncbi:MAG: SDR family oxidoreductase [Pseudomonadales bacterium]|nr:SDR family oxidoreductase [Pseudomonadales bacterium]